MLMTCSTNNGSNACGTTCITAGLFFYLLLFLEAVQEKEADIQFLENDMVAINNCLGPLDQVDIAKIQDGIDTDTDAQLDAYRLTVVLIAIYISTYCLCILPSMICLFRLKA